MATNRLPKIIEALGRTKCPRTHHLEQHPGTLKPRPIFVRNGYEAAVCDGEAHSNAHIDHCMVCLGCVWGVQALAVEVSR